MVFPAGFCYSWLGVGAGVFVVPLLPYVAGLESLEAVQASLLMIVIISFINGVSFFFQRLILWEWVFKSLLILSVFSFLAGFFIAFLSPFQIRLILWLFFLLILCLPYLFALTPFIKNRGFYLFSALAGACSGLTGLGGGVILSPFFHESNLIPSKNIPAIMSCLLFCVSISSLIGQMSQKAFILTSSSELLLVCAQMLPGYLLGAVAGYVVNIKQTDFLLRKKVVRILVFVMFIKMSAEIFLKF